ncbi:MAG: hypothetical protein IH956_07335 [Chloroflexi bacterium]|nr:hypothetical protein [Chloroflexota bacterium]
MRGSMWRAGGMVIDRWIAASARNEADWHDASARALGVETFRTDGVWSREPMRPSIYLSAIALASVRTEPGVVQDIEWLVERDPDATISVRDSFNELDLAGLGFRRVRAGEWWIKDAATAPTGARYDLPPMVPATTIANAV